jgi:hypothetical protein
MNPALAGAIADQHIRDVRRHAARRHAARRHAARRHAAARHRQPRPAGTAGRPAWLRSHLGFALVEAGFYLLAGTRLASRNDGEHRSTA